MVLALGVIFELRAVEIYFAQIARAVPLCLIVEVLRRRIAALSTGRHGSGPHRLAELNNGHKAVAARPINFLRSQVRTRAERRQRAPNGGSEADRYARSCVSEGMHDVIGESLEPVDVSPWRLPCSEVDHKFVGCRRQ